MMRTKTTYLEYYEVNPVSEKELSTPEEIDQGSPGEVGKYLHHHRHNEEQNLERVKKKNILVCIVP